MNGSTIRSRAGPDERPLRVLVTRPREQQDRFCERLDVLGFTPVAFPCLATTPVRVALSRERIAAHALALFTSANAVRHAVAALPLPWPLPVEAIGPATAEALGAHGQVVARPPVPPYTSEAWLGDLARRRPIAPVMIVTGLDGRRTLVEGLAQLSLPCTELSVYRRELPNVTAADRRRVFVDTPPDILATTSDAGLRNLLQLAGKTHIPRLLSLPMIVNSRRAALVARDAGFHGAVLVADPPGDDGQIDCLLAWRDGTPAADRSDGIQED